MKCPKCGCENVNVQAVNEVSLKDVHHGCLWWAFVGWWWIPIKWLCLTIPALLFAIFGHKKQKTVNKTITKCICQNCGYTWNA